MPSRSPDVGPTDLSLSVPGSLNAVTTAPSGRQEKIHRLDANPPSSHRRGCAFVIRRSQRSSNACRSQRCRDVRHLRRCPSVGCYTMTRIIILLPFIERRQVGPIDFTLRSHCSHLFPASSSLHIPHLHCKFQLMTQPPLTCYLRTALFNILYVLSIGSVIVHLIT